MTNELSSTSPSDGPVISSHDGGEKKDREKLQQLQKRSMWKRLVDRIYGYDFFISYRWSDGRHYALHLAEELQSKGYNCFLDSEDYRPGENWLLGGRHALRNTSRLVFLATRDAVTDPGNRIEREDPIISELLAFEEGGRQKVRVLLDLFDDSVWMNSQSAKFFRNENLYLTDLERSGTDVVHELDRWARIDKTERKRTHLFQGIAAVLSVLLIVSAIVGMLARSQANRLKVVAVEGLIRGAFEDLSDGDRRSAASDFASALEIDPENRLATDRLYSMMAHGTPEWVLQQKISSTTDIALLETWTHGASSVQPVSVEIDDDSDNSESISTREFESPNKSWSVKLLYYGGNFQAVQLPFYQIRVSDLKSYDFEKMRNAKGLCFNQNSTLVAVTLDSNEIFVFDRNGLVTKFERKGVVGVSFADEQTLVSHVGDKELWFYDLRKSRAVPLPFSTDTQIQAYTRKNSHWFVVTKNGAGYNLWSYPVAANPIVRTFEAATPGPRDWRERAEVATERGLNVAPERSLKIGGQDGDWNVVAGPNATSRWGELSHALSDEDRREADYQDESFAATSAFVAENAAISADGKVAITSAGRSSPRIWREGSPSWERELPVDVERYVKAVKLDQTGKLAFVLYSSEGIEKPEEFRLYETNIGKQLASGILSHTDELLDVTPDCKSILVSTQTNDKVALEVRPLLSDAEVIRVPNESRAVFSSDGGRLAILKNSGAITIFDLTSKYILSEPLVFPSAPELDSLREPHFSLNGEFVELHLYGTPGKRCEWRCRPQLSQSEALQLVELARQYFDKLVTKQTAAEIVSEFSTGEESVVAELAAFLFSAATPEK